MQAISPGVVLENLSWRAAIKKFDPSRKVPADTWAALERAAVLAPSSCGLQPWKFLVITNPTLRAELRQHSYNQTQITDASHLVVFCRKLNVTPADVDHYVDRIVTVRRAPRDSVESFRQMMLGTINDLATKARMSEWTARQVYIALGVFLSSAAAMGIDACPMEGFDAAQYDKVLGLTAKGLAATVVATVGYRAADDPYSAMAKVRFPHEEVVEHLA